MWKQKMEREKETVYKSDSIIPCFLFVELLVMSSTVVLAYYFEYTETFQVHTQGFFCFDNKYMKPYPGPEELSAAPPALVYPLVSALPMVMMVLGELAAFIFQVDFVRQEKTILTADCCSLNPLLRRVVRFLGVYAFGLFATDIFVNCGQLVMGSLTPHFLTVCRPNFTALGCRTSSQYISSPRACTGPPSLVSSARRAFPSKEAALSMYAALYTVMYVTIMFRAKGTRLSKPVLSLTLVCLAFLTGVVRVSEYRNHWADVLVGFLTGGAIATFLVCCVVHSFRGGGQGGREKPQGWETPVRVMVMALPCVDSPTDKVTGLHSQMSHDRCFFPVTPDVLIPTRSVMSDV